jgi:hypothetical protein
MSGRVIGRAERREFKGYIYIGVGGASRFDRAERDERRIPTGARSMDTPVGNTELTEG